MPCHYAWVIVLTAGLAVFACIGLGRFALGMLLPSMGSALRLGYAEMGLIGTANFVGYLGAVLAIGVLGGRWTARLLVGVGLLLVGGSMCLLALAGGVRSALALYFVTGVGSGAVNVTAMALLAPWFTARHRGTAAGLVVSGNGLAILLSGFLVPRVNDAVGPDGWRVNWLLLGMLSLLIAAACAWLQRDRPEDLGLRAYGADGTALPGSAAARPGGTPRRFLVHLGLVYFGFGFTYVIYATFIVTVLVQEHGLSEVTAGRFWAWVGALSLASGPVFGALSDRLGRKAGLLLVFALQGCAYLLVAAAPGLAGLYLSVVLFGVTAWSVPSIMAAAAGDYLGPARAAAGLGFLTLFFGAGQVAGPALAGAVAESAGSFGPAFAMAAAVVAGAGLLLLALRPPPAH